jgi:acetyl-CoA synthetase
MPDETQETAMAETNVDVSEAQIAVHWKEERYYHPTAKFVGQANLTDTSVTERFSIDKFPECFKEYADMLSWDQYWHTTLDTSNAPFWKWFVGGKLNACYNCVDRHLPRVSDKLLQISTRQKIQF